jgi:large subunit ribosomal protein L1
MSNEERVLEALNKIREQEKLKKEKVKFDQTIDLIINLRNFDVRRESFSLFIQIPNKIKDKKIAAFFEKENKLIHTITKVNFPNFKEKKDAKKLAKEYDSFITTAKLMPTVATAFGRALGPTGKMPAPQLGILANEETEEIKKMIEKVNKSVRIRVKEPSIKAGIGKESLSDEKIVDNLITVYNKVIETLPKGKENVRNVQIKFTMNKPVKVEI